MCENIRRIALSFLFVNHQASVDYNWVGIGISCNHWGRFHLGKTESLEHITIPRFNEMLFYGYSQLADVVR